MDVAQRERDDTLCYDSPRSHTKIDRIVRPSLLCALVPHLWLASSAKTKVVETLLDPDERGWVDRESIFRFVKCMLPGVPDHGLDDVVDNLMITVRAGSQMRDAEINDSSSGRTRRRSTETNSKVFIGEFLGRGDFVDRLTLHI